MKRCCLLLFVVSAIGCGTASPWPSYESALRCHLDGKKEACDKEYKAAIKADPKTQGLHASYGTHLLLTGRMQEAEKEFSLESQNYPTFAPIGIGRLTGKQPIGAEGGAAPAAPPPPAATTAPPTTGAPATTTPAPANKGVAQ